MKKIFLLLSAMSIGAFGSQVSFSHVTPTSTTPFNDTFTLSSFNSSLGTLTGVAIDFSATTTANLQVYNSTQSPGSFTNGFASVPLTITGPSGSTSVSATSNFASGSFGGAVGPYSFAGSPTTVNAPTFNVAPANFALYISPGTPTVAISVSGNSGTYGGTATNGIFFSGNANAGGTTTITYTFTNPSGTPEPATMGLLGSALIGLGLLRFRIKKS